jgi:EpsI family protein
MSGARTLIVSGFLLAQALAVWFITGSERLPAAPDLTAFPAQLGGWTKLMDDPTTPWILAVSKADRLLSRFYLREPGKPSAHLLVAWYSSQRGGDRQPHQPRMCLQGSGWVPETESMVELRTPAGTVNAKRYIIARRNETSALYYWYQTPRRATGDEWASKYWLSIDAARDRRSDGALVRVVVPALSGNSAEAMESAAEFARVVYPELCRLLPQLRQQ